MLTDVGFSVPSGVSGTQWKLQDATLTNDFTVFVRHSRQNTEILTDQAHFYIGGLPIQLRRSEAG